MLLLPIPPPIRKCTAWLAAVALLNSLALVAGDDGLAIVQTAMRVQYQDFALERDGRRTPSRPELDIVVDWNAGVFSIPRPKAEEQEVVDGRGVSQKEHAAWQSGNETLPRHRHGIDPITKSTGMGTDKMPGIDLPIRGLNSWERVAQILPIVIVGLIAAVRLKSVCCSANSVGTRKILELLAAMSLFLVSGPAVIILNKNIMKDYHFHFPIVLASLGQLLVMLITRTSVALGLVELETKQMEWGRYVRVVLLMSVFNFGAQVLGMLAYMFVSVPEIQVLKSITVVLTMIFAAILVKEPVTALLAASVLVIAGGSAVSAVFENDTTRISSAAGAQVIGVVICILGSACEAAKTVCSQILMDSLKVFDGLYWSSPAFMALTVIFVAAIEAKDLVHHPFSGELVGLLVLNSILTGLIVFSSFWFVKLVGALAAKVITQARTVGIILISVFFFREACSSMTYIGYAISLVGIGMFDHVKQRQQEQKKKQEETPDKKAAS